MMSFTMQFVLNGALSLLWNIFNTLQIIMAMELLALALPANVNMLYNLLEDTINFQPVPADTLYDSIIAEPFDLESAEQKR